ncbi:MAG: SDR family NAD(P)-dependent oxidoreductase, partial [Actinomycetota bacterium]|nr:SDR family NAD(P)-dependent oxidoreductase [Actinomycetota bacterium]
MNDPLNVFRLDRKIALVTGASSGIGAQTVKLFSSLGAKVIAAARREDRLQDLANQYTDVMAVRCDVGVEADCKNLVDTIINEYGKIDIL